MIKVGIDRLAIYTPRYVLNLALLAKARGIDPEKFRTGLGQEAMSIAPPGEDIVTMAANAAHVMLQDIDLNTIDLFLFATESGIDQSKAAGIFVHHLLGLKSACRTVELKQACYSATAALQLALPYLRENPYKKVLLIASDIARYGLNTPGESSQGAGAVAMLLSANPRLIAFESEYGALTEDVMDFWRPNYRDEAIVDGKYSSKLYLTMLEKSWQAYHAASNRYVYDHAYFCYHAPVPRLVEKAQQHLCKLNQINEADIAGVTHSLRYGRQMGNSYAAALYVCLSSLFDHVDTSLAGKRIGFYSYGSGCVAEFFSGVVQSDYRSALLTNYHHHLFASREAISYEDYARFFEFKYVEDGSDQVIPEFNTGQYRLNHLSKHKRYYGHATSLTTNVKPVEFTRSIDAATSRKVLAPGKLILSGEHAVVHGLPALAMAIDRYVTATVTDAEPAAVGFDLIDLAHHSHLSLHALKHLKDRIKNKYHRFIRGDFSIREVLQKPFELAQFALGLIAESLDFSLPKGVNVQLQSDIPIGCGMGSSAATILSVMQAIALHLQLPLSSDTLFKMALEAENMQHGHSSGLDLKVALQGGCVFMEGNTFAARDLPRSPLYLVNTGTPASTTGQCVEQVMPHFKNNTVRDEFAVVTRAMDHAIRDQSWPDLVEAVKINHALLTRIGVVPEKVQQFIRAIEKSEGAAKICGAGAILGDRAGAVMVTSEDKAHIIKLCTQYDYNITPITGVTRGVHAA